jgi:hypothetical protein
MQTTDTRPTATPGGAGRKAVLEQMERMLAHPLFKHSKRYPALFRYIVEHTLNGAADLKERTLGIEVFGREPDYDTNADPVVRASAGEIRKRIAQYYLESGHEHEPRINLLPGSYVPEFEAHGTQEALGSAPVPGNGRSLGHWKVVGIIAAASVLVLAAVAAIWFGGRPLRPLDRFWAPVIEATNPLLVCVGQRGFLASAPEPGQTSSGTDMANSARLRAADPTAPISLLELYYQGSQNVAYPDVVTYERISTLLQRKGKSTRLQGESATSFSDLRNGVSILLGAFNNDWTMRLMGNLRFNYSRDGNVFWIRDRQDPGRRDWGVDFSMPYLSLTEDFALITRVQEPSTERMIVFIGGLTGYGTMAASEFLTNPAYMDEVARKAPAGWERKNIQILISTKVIKGNSGPPQVLQVLFW